jgi:hypothetical protein
MDGEKIVCSTDSSVEADEMTSDNDLQKLRKELCQFEGTNQVVIKSLTIIGIKEREYLLQTEIEAESAIIPEESKKSVESEVCNG